MADITVSTEPESLDEYQVEVKESSIHGLGLFSKGRIPKGEYVISITGVPDGLGPETDYHFWVGKDRYLSTYYFKRINFAPKGQCNLKSKPGETSLWAEKDITPGEELTWSYSDG